MIPPKMVINAYHQKPVSQAFADGYNACREEMLDKHNALNALSAKNGIIGLISRLRRTEYDDLDACKAADELEFLRSEVDRLRELLSKCTPPGPHTPNFSKNHYPFA